MPPPSDLKAVEDYLSYLLTDVVQKNETYTYGERINNPKLRVIKDGLVGEAVSMQCNPLEMVIEEYKKETLGRTSLQWK